MGEIRKITTGFVIQRWSDNGVFLGQEFTSGNECEYEDENGEVLDLDEIKEPDYEPYNMVQPSESVIDRQILKSLLDEVIVGNSSPAVVLKAVTALDKI